MTDFTSHIEKLSPEKRALLERRLLKQTVPVAAGQVIPRRDLVSPCPLSFGQQRLWFLQQLEPNSPAYNISAAIRLSGPLDIAALERSLDTIVQRHEVLRTAFSAVEGQPVQIIGGAEPLPLLTVDLSDRSGTGQEIEVRRLMMGEGRRPFDLTQGPLIRTTLLRLAEEEHVLLLTMHHIISDGWSLGVFIRELGALYKACLAGSPPPLPELPIQYADYAVWQRQRFLEATLGDQLEYWKRQLGGALPVLDLPTDRPRPPVQTFRGATRSLVLPKSLSEKLVSLSREEGVTPFMTLLAAFQTLLYRYTGMDDIIVGSPIAGRTRIETEELIGLFVNTLVVRGDLSGNPTFRELLKRVRETAVEAYANQDVPFEKLVEMIRPERSLSRTPLFQVMCVLQAPSIDNLELGSLTISPPELDSETAKFDLTLSMVERPEGLNALFNYNTDLFDSPTITRMSEHFRTLLDAAVTDPGERLSGLRMLTDEERHQLLVEWNDTRADYPETCLHHLFEAQAERTPDAVALVVGKEKVSYRELNRRANQMAHYLRSLGVGPEVLVGICLERSVEMVVGLLGVLKAGGAYVSLDPSYPRERLAFMIEDARVAVLLTQQRLTEQLPARGEELFCVDTEWGRISQSSDGNPDSGVTSENLVYVIYTSGSTGKPKGAMNTHRGICNRLLWMQETFGLTEADRVLQKTPFSFDVSVWELFWPLLNGARLVMARPGGHRDVAHLVDLIAEQGITTVHFVPSMLQMFLEDKEVGRCTSVKRVICSGEALPYALQKRFFSRLEAELHNLYGPTEAAVDVTHWACQRRSDRQIVPIGRPVANTQIYLLDGKLEPVPIGVPGELHIGGVQVGRGYLNRSELTVERFIPDPFRNERGARLYKTGDLARYLPDGNIEYLGRLDHQVKIRGNRVELGEIETVLGQYPAVRETIVVAREDVPGEKHLVAYVVSGNVPGPTAGELRSFLNGKLPEYMLPSAFVMLEALPLTPSGKVDRGALPAPVERRASRDGYVAPKGPLEFLLAQIWEELLGVQGIGVRDDFFELGGHSLLAVRLMNQIERICGRKLPLASLFAGATIEHLAQVLLERQAADFHSPLVKIHGNGSRRPLFFLHGDFGGAVYCLNLARCLGEDQPLYALAPHGLDDSDGPATIEAMATSHLERVRSVQPEGPYLVGGYCNGGVVAFEMARQLQAQGQRVDLLVVIAASAWNAHFRVLDRLITTVGSLLGFHQSTWFQTVRHQILRFRRRHHYYVVRFTHLLRSGLDEQIAFAVKKAKKEYRTIARAVAHRRDRIASHTTLDEPLPHGERPMWEVYRKVLERYVPQPYHGRLTLIWPNEESVELSDDLILGWRKVAAEVEVHRVPGNHMTALTTHVTALGRCLKRCLDQTQEE